MLKKRARHIALLLLGVFVATIAERGFHQLAHAFESDHHVGHSEMCGVFDHDADKSALFASDSDDDVCPLCDYFASQTHFDLSSQASDALLLFKAPQAILTSAGVENRTIGLHPLRGPPSS